MAPKKKFLREAAFTTVMLGVLFVPEILPSPIFDAVYVIILGIQVAGTARAWIQWNREEPVDRQGHQS